MQNEQDQNLNTNLPPIQPALKPVIQVPTEQSTEHKSKLSKWIIVVIVILVLLIVGGTYFLGKNSASKTPKTQEQTAKTASPTPTPDPTANWKTYTNTKHGFSIKYPNNLYSNEGSNKEFSIFTPAPGDFTSEAVIIGVTSRDGDIPMPEYAKVANIRGIQNTQSLASYKTITTLSGLTGYKTTWMVSRMENASQLYESLPFTFFEISSDKTLMISVELSRKDYLSIYETMLSTFKFTNQTAQTNPTSNWKTYIFDNGDSIRFPQEFDSKNFVDTLSIVNSTGDFKLIVNFESTNLDLNNYVDKKSLCVSIKSSLGQLYTINGEKALRFEKNPCGATGSTDIYTVRNGIAYHFNIDTQEAYDKYLPTLNKILESFKFHN